MDSELVVVFKVLLHINVCMCKFFKYITD